MTTRFKNKYRIKSARAPWWNYASAGSYFITICTKYREHYFGDIINDEMQSTPAGIIAQNCWHEIINHTHDIELGEFVVMPNHIHGILKLCDNVSERYQTRINSVSSIIGSYKSAVTKHAHLSGLEMAWQPRFHDHIIRNEQEYARIANYIKSNPGNWEDDRFFGNGDRQK
jgi:putative transposase